ncbi:MAG: penicillin-binding protein activator LpoB [Kiritimatiellae bacterium]|nr:penicillin-binding protein activator LpoB [Kiritimatiellia bacterium]
MKIQLLLGAAAAAILCGCATTARETQLDRQAMSAALEPQDVRRTVEKMVDSMLVDAEVIREVGGNRPVLDISGIKNRSTMHLDMNMITSSIRTKLIRSRMFRFVDSSTSAIDLKTMNDQALNGLVDPNKAVRAGQQSAAQMYLYGELSEMRQSVDDASGNWLNITFSKTTDRYFKFNLNLKDLRSGEIVWTDEQEIRKDEKRRYFGM